MPESECFYRYLPVDDVAMQWGFYVTGAGHAVIPPGEEYPPKGHPALYDFAWNRGRTLPEFAIVLVTEGGGVFESREAGEIQVDDGSLVVLLPGIWHRYRPDINRGWTERWITFNGEIAHRLMRLKLMQPARAVLRLRSLEPFAARLHDVLERIRFHPAQDSVLLSMHTMALLAEAIEQTADETQEGGEVPAPDNRGIEDSLVIRARERIWTQSHRRLSVAQIARELAVTRRTLERRFRAVLDRSLIEDITLCRLSRARRLLSETDLLIKTVAFLSGFPSEEQMRITFLAHEKRSPSDYRRSIWLRKTRRVRQTRPE